MPSLVSYLHPWYARLMFKPSFTTPEALHKRIAKERKSVTYTPPANLSNHFLITERQVGGSPVYDVRPKDLEEGEDVKARAIYLHGGAFVMEILPEHWQVVRFLVAKLRIAVTVPIYPLGPEHKLEEVYAMLQPLYDDMAAVTTTPFYAIGDSAGACLSLALTQLALQGDKPLTNRLVLICPCMDQSYSDPEVRGLSDADPWLHVAGLDEVVRLIAPEMDKRDFRLSPIFGPVDGLPPTLLFAAGRDLLGMDARRWARQVEGKVDIELIVGTGMVHDWPIIDFYEGNVAKDKIVSWLSAPRQ